MYDQPQGAHLSNVPLPVCVWVYVTGRIRNEFMVCSAPPPRRPFRSVLFMNSVFIFSAFYAPQCTRVEARKLKIHPTLNTQRTNGRTDGGNFLHFHATPRFGRLVVLSLGGRVCVRTYDIQAVNGIRLRCDDRKSLSSWTVSVTFSGANGTNLSKCDQL